MNKGFALLELVAATIISVLLSALSIGAYKAYVSKAQFSESLKMMDAEAINIVSANTLGLCTASGTSDSIKGKYGVLTVSGNYNRVSGDSCLAGCRMSYKFNSTEVSKELAGKTIQAQVTAAGQLSKASGTNIPNTALPDTFKTIATNPSCTKLSAGTLTVTEGLLTGSDIATDAALPTNPITPTDSSPSLTADPKNKVKCTVSIWKGSTMGIYCQGIKVGLSSLNPKTWAKDHPFFIDVENMWNEYREKGCGFRQSHTRYNSYVTSCLDARIDAGYTKRLIKPTWMCISKTTGEKIACRHVEY